MLSKKSVARFSRDDTRILKISYSNHGIMSASARFIGAAVNALRNPHEVNAPMSGIGAKGPAFCKRDAYRE